MANFITDIQSENRVTKYLTLKNMYFLIGYIFVAYMFKSYVNHMMFIPYMFFSIACAVYAILPSSINIRRNNLESIFLLFKKDNTVYRPLMIKDGEQNDY